MKKITGVLLANLGTPDKPTTKAVRKFLAEFLHDPRIIELPRWIWYLVLHGTVLRIRPAKVAKLYRSIWTAAGSPLLAISRKITDKLQGVITDSEIITLGMRYGNPSIKDALNSIKKASRIIILPLYPQHSATTTASMFDAVSKTFKTWRHIPELHFINSYADHPLYIKALVNSIQKHWQQHGKPQKLIFSYHGLPQKYIDNGDPYFDECQLTTQKIVEQLNLSSNEWVMTFQSRVGSAKWLTPYTNETLKKLPQENVHHLDVICPGFAVDCLETLEEIENLNKAFFLDAGGKIFHYIPALNDSSEHVALLADLVKTASRGSEESK